jgi:hypothetical protein
MRSSFVAGIATFVVTIIPAGGFGSWIDASVGPTSLNCNRACLENVVDHYLAAVAVRDPKRAPLSADVKYTENSQVIALGDGFWKTAERRGKYTTFSR